MRVGFIIGIAILLIGCSRREGAAVTGAATPHRRPGLWDEAIARDGKPSPLGELKICLDPAVDARLGLFGREAAGLACPHQATTRGPQGSYLFSSTCALGKAGSVTSHGVASGDFSSSYRIVTDSVITGAAWPAANGHHHTVITARYLGACPSDMAPGDAMMGDLRVNVDRLATGAAALGVNP